MSPPTRATAPGASGATGATGSVAVIVPCFNEALTVAKVTRDFLAQPEVVEVLVVDNNSTDGTASLAAAAGARVVHESRPGKGFALVAGLRQVVPADFYVMVDGDDTYPAEQLGELLRRAVSGADMVIGTRLTTTAAGAFRAGHDFGNRMFILLVRVFFGLRTLDLFSGYRVLSRRFVETVPLLARGFEVELELSLQANSNGYLVDEVPVAYRSRPEGSSSKLRTFLDGWRILKSLMRFFRDYRPMAFFGSLSAFLIALSLGFGSIVISGYVQTGLVNRLPMAVLSAALFLLGGLAFSSGTLLSSINRRAAELRDLIARRTDAGAERASREAAAVSAARRELP
jgi:glycosyltransferase involved in cell wall biosynthesis